jgi:hypothetical protein
MDQNLMRIGFERTGGFAGIRICAIVDTDTLSPNEAKQRAKALEPLAMAITADCK